jgi:hypothetical protein
MPGKEKEVVRRRRYLFKQNKKRHFLINVFLPRPEKINVYVHPVGTNGCIILHSYRARVD